MAHLRSVGAVLGRDAGHGGSCRLGVVHLSLLDTNVSQWPGSLVREIRATGFFGVPLPLRLAGGPVLAVWRWAARWVVGSELVEDGGGVLGDPFGCEVRWGGDVSDAAPRCAIDRGVNGVSVVGDVDPPAGPSVGGHCEVVTVRPVGCVGRCGGGEAVILISPTADTAVKAW